MVLYYVGISRFLALSCALTDPVETDENGPLTRTKEKQKKSKKSESGSVVSKEKTPKVISYWLGL